jgi:hypothetical protein
VNWAAKTVAAYAVKNRDQLWRIAATGDTGEQAAMEMMTKSRYEKRDRAADFGTAVHRAIAEGATSIEAEVPYLDAYRRWIEEEEIQIIGQEVPFVYPEGGYGGQIDQLVMRSGLVTVSDVKTGRIYDSYHPQVAGYAIGAGADAGIILHLDGERDEKGELIEGGEIIPRVELVDLASSYQAFRAAKVIAHYLGLPKSMDISPDMTDLEGTHPYA